jgi:serine/threonine protein kinase/tetratricopeptide (TPR) repeat protein
MRLGRYTLDEPIGRGGMGVVWSATLDGGASVAIKLLTSHRARDRRFRASLRREAHTIARLDHPSIVALHDVGEVAHGEAGGDVPAGAPYLVMDLVRGVSLHRHRAQLSWRRLREVLLALLGALAHAHSRGVVHGDLKPSNVMLDATGVRLTDFGVARVAGPGTWAPHERPAGGTPAYMAPELLTGEWRDVGPWTDLFGLGCLAWSLACGRPPHHKGHRYEVMRAQITDPPPRFAPARPVAPAFEAWLHRLLAKDPAHRYRRAADAAWALLRMVEVAEGPEVDVPVGLERPRTTVFWTDTELTTTPARPERGRGQVPPPANLAPIPASWRSLPELGSIARRLAGTGLGLLGVRPPPLVGRQTERDVLWQALRVASGGTARAVVLSGVAGTGQGRLARWLVERAHEAGAAEVLVSHGADGSQSVRRALERVLIAEDLDRSGLQARLQAVAQELPDDDLRRMAAHLRPGLIEGLLRFETSAARRALWLRWLRFLARGRVLVWWIDEAERATEALELCAHLLRERPELPVVAVLTTTDDALDARPDARPLLERITALDTATTCALGPLPDHQMLELVHEVLGLSEALAHELVERAAGNPRYAIQVMRAAADRGHLRPSTSGYALMPGAALRLPRDQHEAWVAAVEQALRSVASRHTAEVAAVLGERVEPELWAAAAHRLRLPHPAGVADELVRHRLMEADGQGYRFAHAMVRGALLDEARTGDRLASHHRACAAVLEQQGAPPGRVGRHHLGAGHVERGTRMLWEAAQRAMVLGAYAEVRTLLRERDDALAATGVDPTDLARRDGRWLLASALVEQGHPRQADEVLAELPADERGDRCVLRGRVAFDLGRVDEAEQHFRSAAEEEPAAAALGLAGVAFERGEGDASFAHAEAAFRHALDAGDALTLARARARQGLCLIGRGEPATALPLLAEGLERFEQLGDRSGTAYSLRLAGLAHQLLGDHRGAGHAYRRALTLFEEVGDRLGARHVHNGLGDLAREAGDLEEAERQYRRAIAGGRQAGGDEGAMIPRLNLGLVLLDQGRVAAADELVEQTAVALAEQGRRGVLGVVQVIRAAVAAIRRDPERARLRLEEGEALLRSTGRLEPDVAIWAERVADEVSDPSVAARARSLAIRQWQAMGRLDEVRRLGGG